MKTSEEAIAWIHSLLPFGIKPGLKRMEWMLKKLNHPEKQITSVHIGGTNGKGSTVSFLRHILEEEQVQVGTFTSPYIERFEERISINGTPISSEDLVWGANKVRPLVEQVAETDLGSPTEFEVITTIMFLYFAERAKPDICLIEVGLGGRFDSTNVIQPIVSIITMIGHDHMHILGETLEEIAFEKAGIIKPNTPIILGDIQGDARIVMEEQAHQKKAAISILKDDFTYETMDAGQFTYQHNQYTVSMLGEHQHHNATLALKACEEIEKHLDRPISNDAKIEGIRKTTWPGRMEWLHQSPALLIDGAHNQEGFHALAQTLKQQFAAKKINLFIGVTEGKDVTPLIDELETMNVFYYCCSFSFFRGLPATELFQQFGMVQQKEEVIDWKTKIVEKIGTAGTDEVIMVTGSLYFISEVRHFLKNKEAK
ncbi:bifunctional folylpolyglutamate synthase/dihydrofolate synthase [Shouchella lehensis]|uniref:Dihydrofolate synthase/folylpolyglutamate synthase n=1 Tax=Shouchella lehensis G1 TaxID=1246626 RepID=A0A060M3P5_9BACI|nr:folylpolyglutamate synthase/dihydrofolate synthase family protein [Shouchella lehensis]AIC95178.1 folylpolyglutamate synthase [Shouchella lehensis G1]